MRDLAYILNKNLKWDQAFFANLIEKLLLTKFFLAQSGTSYVAFYLSQENMILLNCKTLINQYTYI